jgi:hypothetical protein
MHNVVLTGVAAVALLAIAVGGRGQPAMVHQADAAGAVCRTAALVGTANAAWPQLAADTQASQHERRLLVADTEVGGRPHC